MKKFSMRGIVKNTFKALSVACVDACVAYGASMAVPATMVNPVLGVMIVIGSAVATTAACDRVIDPFVDDTVDKVADEYVESMNDVKNKIEDIKAINTAEEIYSKKGKDEAVKFLKETGFTGEQIEEIFKDFKK